MEKAQLSRKEVAIENRKAGNTHFRIPSLGWTGGITHWNHKPSLHLAQDFTAKHHLFISLLLVSSVMLFKYTFMAIQGFIL